MRAVRLTLLSVVLVFMSSAAAVAQETGTVTGQVVDASTGAPLTGVQMQVAGTNVGGLTDTEGRFLLTRVPAGQQTIRAILIGYSQGSETVTVTAGGTATADFQLETSAVALEAVIVSAATGREQRLRELGANVAAIGVDDLNPAPITSFADALGGRASGVIMQDVNGTTGTSQRIRIRGANSLSLSNEPLIYIDGVRMNNDMGGAFDVGGQEPSRLNDINPNDIANIEIVKGPAAAAMYGTAAANGVILITTKRGRPGNTQWNAWAEYGQLEDVTDYPGQFLAYEDDDAGSGIGPFITQDVIDAYGISQAYLGWFSGMVFSGIYTPCPNYEAAEGNCVQEETLSYNALLDERTRPFSTGDRNRYGASVRGGNEDVRYFISGQYETETGVIDINETEKVNLRANVDAKLAETVDLSFSFGYTDSFLALNNNDNSIFSPILNGLTAMPYYMEPNPAIQFGAPINRYNYGWYYNMDMLSLLPTQQEIDRFLTSANMQYRPTSWLTVNASGGLDYTSNFAYETLGAGDLPISPSYAAGYRSSYRSNGYLYTGQLSGVGTFDVTDELLSTTTVGGSFSKDNSTGTQCYGEALVPGTSSCATAAQNFSVSEDWYEVRTVGAYVQQELAWRDRVFLAGGIRGDDNSAFGTDFGFAYYPNASLSWVVADEEWFPDLDWMTTLRLRTAWGISGLQPGFRDAVTLYEPYTVSTAAQGDVPGVSLDVTGNPLLEPEKSEEWEFGFDSGFFEDRLSLAFTYFNKISEDALVARNLPGSIGITTSVLDNIGSIKNAGTELSAELMVFETESFGLNVGLSNTTLENEILEAGDFPLSPFNRGLQRHAEGFPAGGFWQPEVTYEDADGNGLLSLDEVFVDTAGATYIGPSMPTWQRSLFADARLFDWLTVSTLIEGRGGNYQGNDSEAFRCGVYDTWGCPAVGDPNATLEEQAAYLADRYGGSTGVSSAYLYVEEADFYKWRELSVTLSTPDAWAQRFDELDGLRLTFAGRNLATWTDYPGLDPETVEGGGAANFSQSEFNTQPPVRYLMVRLDYTF